MLEKIRRISWIQWTVIIVSFIILTVLVRFGLTYIENINLDPWSNALQVSNNIALDNFKGEATGDTVFVKQRLAALIGIIFYFILGPSLLILYGYESKSSGEKSSQGTSLWSFKAGIIITLMCLILFTLGATFTPIIQSNTRASASRSEKIDELRQDLILLGADSFEYMVLPERYGGGNGSFQGLQLDNLPSYNNTTSKSYSIQETSSDTVLKIIARGTPDYAVEKGELGEVSVSVEVRPSMIMTFETLKEKPEGDMSIMTQFNRPLEIGWETITK